MAKGDTSTIAEPQGAVVIWNYEDRLGTLGLAAIVNNDEKSSAFPQNINETIILTASLKSITTSKTKKMANGKFEFRLAPTFNWVTRITPGSWCSIIMTRDEHLFPPLNPNALKGKSTRDKFFGKIESVRENVTVSGTGARSTEYIVTGVDWADAFNQTLYVDPLITKNIIDKQTNLGGAAFLGFTKMAKDYNTKKGALPTSGNVVRAIVGLWGAPLKGLTAPSYLTTNILGAVEKTYEMPLQAAIYMGFTSDTISGDQKSKGIGGIPGKTVGDLIKIKEGRLIAPDTYSGDPQESKGFPDPTSILGNNTIWNLILGNCNYTLFECIADLSWKNPTQADMTLFRRIRPFVNRTSFPNKGQVSNLISPFKFVKTVEIPYKDIITINFGTNSRDRINFIELLPSLSLMPKLPDLLKAGGKLDAQVFDSASISRDGFKPMIDKNIKYVPWNNNKLVPSDVGKWKYLLKEWYFNTHLMLNGSFSMVGQNEYIRIGDNIRIDARILGEANMNAIHNALAESPALSWSDAEMFLTCHVEGVNHNFSVDPNSGARIFKTIITFVRGVVTDEEGNIPEGKITAIDDKASSQSDGANKNKNVLGTSTKMDPDTRKLKGN